MKDLLCFLGVYAGWFVLSMWVLPYFGIQTCMSGACRADSMTRSAATASADQVPAVVPEANELPRK